MQTDALRHQLTEVIIAQLTGGAISNLKDLGPEHLEHMLTSLEVASVTDRKDPRPLYALTIVYRGLPQELPHETKSRIEQEKFKAEGREHVLTMPSARELLARRVLGTTSAQQCQQEAFDYICQKNSRSYIEMENIQRALRNFGEAIERSGPVHQQVMKATLALLVLDERVEPYMPILQSVTNLGYTRGVLLRSTIPSNLAPF